MIFNDISGYTGGNSVYVIDPEDGVRQMTNITFPHYNVDLSYNGKVEEKKIVLRNKKVRSSDLNYPSLISRDDLEQIISNISLKARTIPAFAATPP